MAFASTRRSRTRAISTGPTFWGCSSGKRCPARIATRGTVVERLTREWIAAVERDLSHPCIIAWVPFNESWGVPDLPDSPAQRHYVQALYHLTKTLDPTRPVIGNDGWESVATDIIGIHDYDPDSTAIARRYGGEVPLPRLFQQEHPGAGCCCWATCSTRASRSC